MFHFDCPSLFLLDSLPSFPADKEVPIIPPANTNMLQTLWFLSLCCDAIPTEMRSHSVLSADVSKAIVSAAQNASAQVIPPPSPAKKSLTSCKNDFCRLSVI
jgi:hypothetical protein